MSENHKNAEQEPKNEKQTIELTDLAQELSNTELEDVQGGGVVNPKTGVTKVQDFSKSRASRGRIG